LQWSSMVHYHICVEYASTSVCSLGQLHKSAHNIEWTTGGCNLLCHESDLVIIVYF